MNEASYTWHHSNFFIVSYMELFLKLVLFNGVYIFSDLNKTK